VEQLAQGHARVPVIGGFQDAAGQGTTQPQLGSLSNEKLDQSIFQRPSQPGLFYGSMTL